MVKRDRSIHTNLLNQLFSFPETINEYVARVVASFVFVLTIEYLISGNILILYFIAYGFFAGLESSLGFCAGCWFFKLIMSWGWIPEKICAQCNDILLSKS